MSDWNAYNCAALFLRVAFSKAGFSRAGPSRPTTWFDRFARFDCFTYTRLRVERGGLLRGVGVAGAHVVTTRARARTRARAV